MKYNKGFAPLIVLLIALGVLVVGGVAYYAGKKSTPPQPATDTSTTSTTQTASSDCTASSSPSITILSPNGGETYQIGQSITIKWKTCNAKPGQTISLSIGKLIPASQNNGIPGASNPVWRFNPAQTTNDGSETVILNNSSTDSGYTLSVIPFTPGTNYQVSAVLNPLSTDTHETAYVYDASDDLFTINNPTVSTALPQYIGSSSWPPVIRTSSTSYSCTVGSTGGDAPTIATQRVIGTRTYCVTKGGDGYAGGYGYTYSYTTANGNGTKATNFTLLYQSCGVWQGDGTTKYSDCQTTQSTFNTNLDKLIDSLM